MIIIPAIACIDDHLKSLTADWLTKSNRLSERQGQSEGVCLSTCSVSLFPSMDMQTNTASGKHTAVGTVQCRSTWNMLKEDDKYGIL